ncbi:MAG: GGDEF domain-containing protein, partial [Vicinamibacteria bacterium]
FSEPISRGLDIARDIERSSGLALMPALLLLTGVFIVHQLRKRHEVLARAAAADAARTEAEKRAAELEQLVGFGHALARSLDYEAIRGAVTNHLPRLVGTDDIWVLLRRGSEWEALTGDTRTAGDAMARENLASQALTEPLPQTVADRSVVFPMIVGGTPVGVLGVAPTAMALSHEHRRVVEAAAALLAVSVKNAQLFKDVKEHSLRDPLTGCVTRPHGMEVIDAELRRARRSQMPVSMVMFDLDHFKEINDRYGHLCGDAVLAAVGRRMRDVLRGSDVKCRYGGEEFLVLLPETPLAGARRVSETLRREIADRPIPWAGEALAISASFGITQALPGEVNIEALIGRADQALYRAKHEGRNCVRIA